MQFFRNGSIRKSLTILVVLSVLPAFVILFYTGLERRQQTIEATTQQVTLTVRGMAEQQREITRSTQQLLNTISRLPDIKQLNIDESASILRGLIEQNTHYNNLALVALDGNVITSARGHTSVNLADRKHFKEALSRKEFVVGEFIISRVGSTEPVFPSAIPVLDDEDNPVAVLTIAYKLNDFSRYLDTTEVPSGSFVAVTDHKGVRIYYYPEKIGTNPVGKLIKSESWEIARISSGSGSFTSQGSDAIKKIFAFESISLNPGEPPYIYVWSGIPEKLILAPANNDLLNSLLLLSLALIMSILVAHFMGKKLIITPLLNLVQFAEQLSKGDLEARNNVPTMVSEFDLLSNKFNQMAESLQNDNERISKLSLVDGLTNIANRRCFDKKLDIEWNRSFRTKRPVSLLMIDIDYFKRFNDTYGHLAGDECLRTIGLILKSIANRASDLPARYGGEEFAVILPETDKQGAFKIAELIHTQIAQRGIAHKTSNISQHLTVSIGFATFCEGSSIKSPIDLIKMSDEQLYKAKQEDRNKTSG